LRAHNHNLFVQSLVNDKTRELDQLFRVDYGVTHWTFQPEGADCQIRNSSTKKEEHISTSVNSPMNFLTIGPAGAFLATADSSKPTGGAGQFKIGVVLAFNDSDSSSNDPSFLAFCRVGAKCNNQAGKVGRDLTSHNKLCLVNKLWFSSGFLHVSQQKTP
jgi:hypothetical protein